MILDILYISSIQNEDKGAKVKKSATKGKKDASAAQNGETKNEVRGVEGGEKCSFVLRKRK